MIRAVTVSTALLGLLILAGGASAAHHEAGEAKPELPAWDQADVSSLARDLQHIADRLRAQERSMPESSLASGQSAARERYRDLLRGLENEARSLADLVGKGKSREDSETLYLRIQELGRDVAEEARRMFLSRATIDEIEKAEDRMNKLRAYYTGESPLPSALVGPSKDDDEGGKKAE